MAGELRLEQTVGPSVSRVRDGAEFVFVDEGVLEMKCARTAGGDKWLVYHVKPEDLGENCSSM